MAIAKGRSCSMGELDILKDALENMINSTELKFRDIIDSLKACIFDLEHDTSTDVKDRNSVSISFYSELEKFEYQRNISRNKLVICIYSICEATLASICEIHKIKLVKEPNSNNMLKLCPYSDDGKCKVKRRKREEYYLTDYLYTIDPNYKMDWGEANIVSTAIKNLRNYLTHSKADVKRARKIISELSSYGFNHISQSEGKIMIQEIEDVYCILNVCCKMLVGAEQKAKEKLKSSNKNI